MDSTPTKQLEPVKDLQVVFVGPDDFVAVCPNWSVPIPSPGTEIKFHETFKIAQVRWESPVATEGWQVIITLE
jgi:hypothetical protein